MAIQQQDIKYLTDLIYVGLFGEVGDLLRVRLGLPMDDSNDDDNLRDAMGIEALQALSEVESAIADEMSTESRMFEMAEMATMARRVSRDIAPKWKLLAKLSGVDFLTGKPLDTDPYTGQKVPRQ